MGLVVSTRAKGHPVWSGPAPKRISEEMPNEIPGPGGCEDILPAWVDHRLRFGRWERRTWRWLLDGPENGGRHTYLCWLAEQGGEAGERAMTLLDHRGKRYYEGLADGMF